MKIEKINYNPSFNGKVFIKNESQFEKINLKYLINKALHHAGSKDVRHDIYIGNVYEGSTSYINTAPPTLLSNTYAVTIRTSYKPKTKVDGVDGFSRETTAIVDSNCKNGACSMDNRQMQKELAVWLEKTKPWYQKIRVQEKALLIEQSQIEEQKNKSLFSKIRNLFK